MADSTMVGPSMYLEKPVTPDSYLGHICRIVGVAHEAPEEDPNRAEELKREVGTLLENADAKTIEAMLDQLKRAGK